MDNATDMRESRYARQLRRGVWTLRFKGELEPEYRRYHVRFMRWHLRTAMILAAFIVVFALLINNFGLRPLPPAAEQFNLYLGGILLPGCILIARLLHLPVVYQRGPQIGATMVAIATAIFAHLEILFAQGGAQYPYQSFLLVGAFAYLVSSVRFLPATGMVLGVFASYMVVQWMTAPSAWDMSASFFNMFAVSSVAGAGAYLQEYITRSNFLHRRISEYQITHDALTGLLNRRGFTHKLDTAWSQAVRDGEPVAMIVMDVDHFKAFNDTYGHAAGDQCLRKVGQTMRHWGGRRPLDVCGRVGGEEFAAVLVGADAQNAAAIVERLRERVESLLVRVDGEKTATTSISAGIVALHAHRNIPAWEVLKVADGALYQAKTNGRNRIELAPSSAVHSLKERFGANTSDPANAAKYARQQG